MAVRGVFDMERARSRSRRAKAVLLACLAVVQAAPAAVAQEPETVPEAVEELVARPEFEHSSFGLAFYSLDTEELVYARNADALFTPASTTKLLTEGALLGVLGADHRFRTRVYRTGPVDPDGTLDGDLVLVASGDPNLSNRVRPDGTLAFEDHDHAYGGSPETRAVPGDPLRVIQKLAEQVADRGIERVAGHVLVDATLFPEGEREQGSGVVISPLAVNDNVVDVTVEPGAEVGAPVSLRVSPRTGYVRFVNEATTGPSDSEPSIRWSDDVRHSDGTRTVTVAGTMPVGGPSILYAYGVPTPSRFGEVAFAEALQEHGVVAGPAPADLDIDFGGLESAYTSESMVAEHVSPPVSEEVKVTLKVSQNLHAGMVPYLLGALPGGDSAATIEQRGFDREREFLAEAGLDLSGASQGDGAGGDRVDFFTPRFMVSYLAQMAGRPDFDHFREALPVLGRDGTLATIQTESAAAGHVRAKTGTYILWNELNRSWMLTAKALAGYLTTADGERFAFALFLNRMPSTLEPNEAADIAGEALGEIAAAAYRLPMEGAAATERDR